MPNRRTQVENEIKALGYNVGCISGLDLLGPRQFKSLIKHIRTDAPYSIQFSKVFCEVEIPGINNERDVTCKPNGYYN
jgi:hypothetical protein